MRESTLERWDATKESDICLGRDEHSQREKVGGRRWVGEGWVAEGLGEGGWTSAWEKKLGEKEVND